MDVKVTLGLLSQLEKLGFNDEAFWRLHHRKLSGQRDTINAHRKYCLSLKSGRFIQGEANELVAKRLAFVLDKFQAPELTTRNSGIFVVLAEAAFEAIPPLGARLSR